MSLPLLLGGTLVDELGSGDGTVTVDVPTPVPSGWESLRGVVAAGRTTAVPVAPVACWYDGEPLLTARGVLHCRFCGRTY